MPLCPCWKHAIQITDAGKLPLSPWPEMNPGVQARIRRAGHCRLGREAGSAQVVQASDSMSELALIWVKGPLQSLCDTEQKNAGFSTYTTDSAQ